MTSHSLAQSGSGAGPGPSLFTANYQGSVCHTLNRVKRLGAAPYSPYRLKKGSLGRSVDYSGSLEIVRMWQE